MTLRIMPPKGGLTECDSFIQCIGLDITRFESPTILKKLAISGLSKLRVSVTFHTTELGDTLNAIASILPLTIDQVSSLALGLPLIASMQTIKLLNHH